MRTDIPAFYPKWLINRIKAGFFCVRNPYNPDKITSYSLSTDITDLFLFCTKNPAPLLPYLSILTNFRQGWHVTITGYNLDIESNLPHKNDIINATKFLSNQISNQNVVWRYDPILITDKYTVDFHVDSFSQIANKLKNYVSSCVISFIEVYPKISNIFHTVSLTDKCKLISKLSDIASKNGILLKLCGSKSSIPNAVLSKIDISGCQTKQSLEKLSGYSLNLPMFKPKRPECNCYLGIDMGVYNSCPHFCKYCYANNNQVDIIKNNQNHNPDSPILIGEILQSEKVTNAICKSYRNLQPTLF